MAPSKSACSQSPTTQTDGFISFSIQAAFEIADGCQYLARRLRPANRIQKTRRCNQPTQPGQRPQVLGVIDRTNQEKYVGEPPRLAAEGNSARGSAESQQRLCQCMCERPTRVQKRYAAVQGRGMQRFTGLHGLLHFSRAPQVPRLRRQLHHLMNNRVARPRDKRNRNRLRRQQLANRDGRVLIIGRGLVEQPLHVLQVVLAGGSDALLQPMMNLSSGESPLPADLSPWHAPPLRQLLHLRRTDVQI